MNIYKQRIENLRNIMKEKGVDFYLIPTSDFHNSEYVHPYFKTREFMSGFSGSNGSLLISRKDARLWTDGRYFIQAANELEGSDIILMKMGEANVPTLGQYLAKSVLSNDVLAFDGRCVSQAVLAGLQKLFTVNVFIKMEEDLVDFLWEDRPKMPAEPLFYMEDSIAGESINAKLDKVRAKINDYDGLFLSKLDDIMWLFNIRGNDIDCNPVALSYAFIAKDYATLFLQDEADKSKVLDGLDKAKVIVKNYSEVFSYLEEMTKNQKIYCAKEATSARVIEILEKDNNVVYGDNPTELLKAMKNEVEIASTKDFYLKDSAKLTEFIYWVKQNVGKIEINEYSAAMKLDSMRAEIDGFLGLSFPTISGYKENAAMMHYCATETNNKKVKAEGFLLVDSGAQYMGATTDVTRTISLGNLTSDEKTHYTLTALSMLELMHANWLYGCTGRNLDILARMRLWKIGIDYKCGTGHGIGYTLNVHEGPQNIRWKYADGMKEAIIEAGMIISNEPGVYLEGSHGIRIENIHVTKNIQLVGSDQFMAFDNLTSVPLDRDALEVSLMNEDDLDRVNQYQKVVFDKVSPYLSEDAKKWLEMECAPLCKK